MGLLSILSLIWGILATLGMAVAIIPFLGALNYLNIPFAVFGLLFSILAFIVSSNFTVWKPKSLDLGGKTALVCEAKAFFEKNT